MEVPSQRWHDKSLELKSDNLDEEEITDFSDSVEVNQQDSTTDWLAVKEELTLISCFIGSKMYAGGMLCLSLKAVIW